MLLGSVDEEKNKNIENETKVTNWLSNFFCVSFHMVEHFKRFSI